MDEWEEIKASAKPISKKNIADTGIRPKKINQEAIQRKQDYVAIPAQSLSSHPPELFISREIIKRMEKGDLKPVTLDLHGYTIDSAFVKVESFIRQNFARERRLLLIITGHGKGDITIHSEFQRWLNDSSISAYISQYQQAPASLGGSGAWLLYLKKQKV